MGQETALPLSPLPAVNRGLKGWGVLGELMPLRSCCAGRWPQGASTQIAWLCAAWAGAAALSRCRHSVPHTPLIAGSQIPAPGQRPCGCRPSRGALITKEASGFLRRSLVGLSDPRGALPAPIASCVFSVCSGSRDGTPRTRHHGLEAQGTDTDVSQPGGWTSEIRLPADSVPGGSCVPSLRTAAFSCTSSGEETETDRDGTYFFYKDANPITPPNLI